MLVDRESLVLLTGASGFLAAHVGEQLLKAGYRVRGTVRSKDKGEYLRALYAKDGLADKFEYVIVEDVEPEGAFDEAVKGCDAVQHTASPFHFNTDSDPHKTLINPAIRGTENALKSAATEPKIKRFVFTSSFAAIVNPYDPVYTFTERDWNEFSPKQVEEKGKDVDGGQAYRASKTLAERAAWKWAETNKPAFDLVAINPPLIFGPVIHQIKSADSLNTSVGAWYQYLIGKKKDEEAANPSGMLVDVRDVAKIHVESLSNKDAGNQRFAVSNHEFYGQQLLDILHSDKHSDLLEAFPNATRGKPGCAAPKQNKLDASKAQKTFGWKPIPTEQTVVDMTRSLAERQKEW